MDAASLVFWLLAGCAVCVHLAACVGVALQMHKIGRNGLKWFAICLLITAVPAWIVLLRNVKGKQAGDNGGSGGTGFTASGMRRCPHCLRLITLEEFAGAPAGICPRCGLTLEKDRLA